jgi:hypothetical protein
MSSDAADPTPPRDPRSPCNLCGSLDHPTGHHGGPDVGYHDGGYPTSLETEKVLENRDDADS